MSEYFRVHLLQIEFDRPAAIRMPRLAIGLEVGDEDYADAVHDKCRRNELLVSTEGSTVLLLPSLVKDKRTAGRGLDILDSEGPSAAASGTKRGLSWRRAAADAHGFCSRVTSWAGSRLICIECQRAQHQS